MQQMNNIVRLEEGGVSTPYIVLERISQSETPTLREGLRLVGEQKGNEVYKLICEPIKDAVFEDIDSPKEEKQPTENTYSESVTDNNDNNKKEVTL